MLRVTKLADYAILVMIYLAKNEQNYHHSKQISEQLGLGYATTSKLLKLLTKKCLVISQKGSLGGYKIAQTSQLINIVHIIEAIDGPIYMTGCQQNLSECNIVKYCEIKRPWQVINILIIKILSQLTLEKMISISKLSGELIHEI